jgi:hypothetical protein
MITRLCLSPAAGPLTEVVVDLVTWLGAEGYARGTAMGVTDTAARLGAWMGEARLDLKDLDDGVLDRFVAAQRCGQVRIRHRPTGS